MSLVPDEISIIGDMFGNLPSIKFDDHNHANIEAFLELVPELYLERILRDIVLKVVPIPWARGLAGSGLLNLLWIPHFGQYNITNLVVWQLLALIHDGSLWIEEHIPIVAALIHQITSLPMKGPNPMNHIAKMYEQ